MDNIQLNNANIKNLTQLWKIMGTQSIPLRSARTTQMSISWPYRYWFESTPVIADLTYSVNQVMDNYLIPVWEEPNALGFNLETVLITNGFKIMLEQTAMYLDLKTFQEKTLSNLKLLAVSSGQDIKTWTDIAEQSFMYEIDQSVIENIAINPDIKLLTAYLNDVPVATALLFTTDNIVGIHQVGVLAQYRGQGIARKLIQDVIKLCNEAPNRYITLQASSAGESLYKSLGFKEQFKIRSFQRINKTIS